MPEETPTESPSYHQPAWWVKTVNQYYNNYGLPPDNKNTPKLSRRNLLLGGATTLLLALALVVLFAPADSNFGWIRASIEQRNCRNRLSQQPCIVVARLSPTRDKASANVTRLMINSLGNAMANSSMMIVSAHYVQGQQEALALARRYAAPLIVWGEVYEFNDVNAAVHLDLVDRLGIGQGGELEPFRLQHFPVESASIRIDIPCETEAGCLGTETGRLVLSAPAVARLAIGLTNYALRQVSEAQAQLDPIASCILTPNIPTCLSFNLLTDQKIQSKQALSLILYYTGRTYGMQQDDARAIAHLEQARALDPRNPALAIATGWSYLNWGGGFVPVEATAAFAKAQRQLGNECDANITGPDAGERLYSLGVIHELQAQWPAAETCYALAVEALTVQKSDPYAVLINLARVQRFAGRTEAAQTTLAHAQKLSPDLPWAELELAQLTAGNESESRTHLEKAAALAPNSLQVHITRAELCASRDDVPCAESAFAAARAVSDQPYVWLLVKMGDFYRQQEDWSQAQKYLEEAIAAGASNPLPYEGLGYVLLRQEKWAEAADAYGQAIDRAYSDEAARHLFCPLSNLLASLQQDNISRLQKCIEWSEDEGQRAWATQRLQDITP